MEEAMKVTNLTRVFKGAGGEFTALKNINLSIPAGKLTILKGRSGSGKTTLMNILGTLDEPTSGSVMLNGMELTTLSERKREILRRTEMGFVFQAVSLMPTMNAYQNVEFALRMAGWRMKNKARVEECLRMVGLGKRMKHMPAEMSGGEQQRVAIARAMAVDPEIIYFDEPTSALDPELTGEVLRVLRDLADQKTTMIIVTHEMSFARDVADRILFMDGGVVVEEGPAHQVIEHPHEERTKQFLSHYGT